MNPPVLAEDGISLSLISLKHTHINIAIVNSPITPPATIVDQYEASFYLKDLISTGLVCAIFIC